MQNSWNFSMCISTLLNILDISSNKLAKAINVDPSLISRWKTGKRKVSHESNHLKAMADYFSSKILNDYQKTNIINIISKFNLPISIQCSNNIKEYIYILLISSLQSSNNEQVKSNNLGTSNINDMINPNFGINTDHNKNICYPSHMIDNKSAYLQQHTFTETGYISNFEMIIGHSNVINAGINLLKSLPKKPDYIKESILITFLTELDSFSNFESTNLEWHNALLDAQSKGWSINKLMNINENINSNMKIINEFLVNIMSKKYHPYYLNKYDSIIK
ncbi:MAG: helix-turn-helix transcriptional regulator, partial [Clostridiaceae bacterium]|nr:helix-turn-helix transcriptional regulator [Clostridiaceae bacterium]